MRFLIAMLKHETNTFSPVRSDLARFVPAGEREPLRGARALAAYRGTGTAIGGFLDIAAREHADVEIPVAAAAVPSGPVEDDAYAALSEAILEAVRRGGYDGILLDLHGAMVTRRHEDGEGTLLARIRDLDPRTPVAVAYDMHANLYDDMLAKADVVAGYHTYPHVDACETGRRAGDVLVRRLRGEVRPTTAWGRAPMLPHVMRQSTDDEPNRTLQVRAVEMERGEALCASVFTGFPHADVRNAGLSVAVVTDNDVAKAQRLRDELLQRAWDAREAFVYRVEKLEDAVARAKRMAEGPVFLLDHYDNAASGGTMDTTRVLEEILRQELENVAAFALFDPEAVRRATAAGVGVTVTLSVGGKLAMPMLPAESRPIEVTGTVKTLSNGKFRARGPMSRGVLLDMGPSAVLDTGRVEIALVSRQIEPFDVNALLCLDMDPAQKRYVMLKSRIHWRAGMRHLAKAVVECAGVGVCTSDYGQHEFKRLRRPIYPLDRVDRWSPR
jgi:microcystin degradation protein MlrC